MTESRALEMLMELDEMIRRYGDTPQKGEPFLRLRRDWATELVDALSFQAEMIRRLKADRRALASATRALARIGYREEGPEEVRPRGPGRSGTPPRRGDGT